jgi:NADH:ubiquinone oxidoreductase subunit F (NADH-binding)
VETLCNIPIIISKGAKWYGKLGTDNSKGTKLFCVSGDVENPGVFEMEMGTSLKELMDLAGAKDIKMVQVGGSVGSIIPSDKLDTPLGYETALGSGAVMVFNDTRDVVDLCVPHHGIPK